MTSERDRRHERVLMEGTTRHPYDERRRTM
jgi:hypothetical protein